MLPLNSYILSSRSQQENSNTSKTSQRIELKRESNLKLVTFIQINPLIYAVVTKDGQCTKEIKRRILMERTAISKRGGGEFKDKNVTKKERETICRKILKYTVVPRTGRN